MKQIKTDELNALSRTIIGCAYSVHNVLGFGFLEKVYENALQIELQEANLKFETQKSVNVFYKNQLVGEFIPDLLVEDQIIVGLKSVKDFSESHFAQCINYLKATGLPICLLLNFGKDRVTVKRFVNPLINLKLDNNEQ